MKKVNIKFPQIIIQIKEVEITDEEYKYLTEQADFQEVTEFIWDNMNELEQNCTYGEKWTIEAIDADLGGIDLTPHP